MALALASSGDLLDIRPFGPTLRELRTHTLVQAPSMELFRMVIRPAR